LLMALLIGAFVMTASPAIAMEKAKDEKAMKAEKGKATTKVIAEDDKVRVQEVRSKPGDVNTTVASSSHRVVRALKGGTLLRTYADGKTEKIEYKTGEVKIIKASPEFT